MTNPPPLAFQLQICALTLRRILLKGDAIIRTRCRRQDAVTATTRMHLSGHSVGHPPPRLSRHNRRHNQKNDSHQHAETSLVAAGRQASLPTQQKCRCKVMTNPARRTMPPSPHPEERRLILTANTEKNTTM